jgi:hypothetical protein
MTNLDYLVTEITVTAQSKVWVSRVQQRGDSSGTDITWTAKPAEGIEGWTPSEAKKVSLSLRRDMHAALVADARCRGVDPPDAGEETLKAYDVALKTKNGSSDDNDRKDSSDT